jgi:hypothetical protein
MPEVNRKNSEVLTAAIINHLSLPNCETAAGRLKAGQFNTILSIIHQFGFDMKAPTEVKT